MSECALKTWLKHQAERSQVVILQKLDALPPRFKHRLANQLGFAYAELDPTVRCMLALQKKQGRAGFLSDDLAQDRQRFDQQMRIFNVKPTAICQIKNYSQPFVLRHYHPKPSQPLPLIVFFHGGGFVMGSIESHDEVCRVLANAAQAQIISVQYPLAPEHSPTQLIAFAESALDWIVQQATQWNVLDQRIALAGDSAGGNIAAVLAQRVAKKYAIQAQLLIYPALDFVSDYPSYQQYGADLLLTEQDIQRVRHYYVQTHQLALNDALISPCYGQVAVSPATFIVTAGHDVLYDEARAYLAQLNKAEVKTCYYNYPAQTHGFIQITALVKSSKQAVIEFAQAFRAFWDQLEPPQVSRET